MVRLMLGVLVLSGCFEAEGEPKVTPVPKPTPGEVKPGDCPGPARVAPTPEGTATLSGKVHINGKVRPPKGIPLDPACSALHPEPLRPEGAVVDDSNYVRWAFVWIKRGLEGKTFPVPAEPVLLDQEGCRYHPHVFGIRAGQMLRIRNSDPFLHNIHGLPFESKEFNIGQPIKGQENDVSLLHPEIMVKIKCDVHNWMGAWAGVLDHPFFAVTDPSGSFTIPGIPPGTYTLGVWQEEWTTQVEKPKDLEIVLKAGEVKAIAIELEKKKE
jgi:hypothetical protein